MSSPMVRAILEGKKIQTRRAVRLNAAGRVEKGGRNWHVEDAAAVIACPYGQAGDELWVRETWAPCNYFGREDVIGSPIYRASFPPTADERHDAGMIQEPSRWRPSIFMPRAASRITLRITDVRVELLQDISEADAIAEGAKKCLLPMNPAYEDRRYTAGFGRLWESINGNGSWDQNPFVWAISFERTK